MFEKAAKAAAKVTQICELYTQNHNYIQPAHQLLNQTSALSTVHGRLQAVYVS